MCALDPLLSSREGGAQERPDRPSASVLPTGSCKSFPGNPTQLGLGVSADGELSLKTPLVSHHGTWRAGWDQAHSNLVSQVEGTMFRADGAGWKLKRISRLTSKRHLQVAASGGGSG